MDMKRDYYEDVQLLRRVLAASVEVMDKILSSHALRLRESGAEAVLMWLTPKHGAILLPAAAKIDFFYERITDWVGSGIDIDEAIRRLDAGR